MLFCESCIKLPEINFVTELLVVCAAGPAAATAPTSAPEQPGRQGEREGGEGSRERGRKT